MGETFFIADTHFGHRGVIKFGDTYKYRPFDTIEEHDEELVRRWNSVVGRNDVVYVLGDFCFGSRNLFRAGLCNGLKKLVMGNHDTYPSRDYLKYFQKLHGAVEYKGMILAHIPAHPSQFPRYSINIHGHLHHLQVQDTRYVNVSAEQINLTPISYDDIRSVLKNGDALVDGLRG